MHLRGQSFGVIGALSAFPLRLAAKRVTALGGRLHRNFTRGTTTIVVGRTLLTRLSETELETRLEAARANGARLLSENGFLKTLGTLPETPPANIDRQALLDQSRLSAPVLDLLTLLDAFEHHAEPFSFRDVILAKKYAGLIASGANWSAIARSVHQIGPVGSLTALTLHAGADKILTSDNHSLAELGGQRLLDLPETDDEAEDYFGLAENAEAAELYAEAASLYQHCSAIDTSDATAPFNLGNCLRQLDDIEGAALAYATALKRDPLFIEAWFNYGGLFRDMGRIDAARQHLIKAATLDPTFADAVYNLGALEYDAGNLNSASGWWRSYLQLDQSSDWARRARAGISLAEKTTRDGTTG
ncbi:tetratricopeptide repeat protein [Devosia rhodophyticola]|uniref:Tetratricopeptide repeat protein n=1 Tax=Devosia rhodophyticola TaxID=3026423 RepID=A0ABY7YV82_9HYPH|nr:tetratricopeptide repeat protein [Devosia rhodophyticola]WDR05273.1 tetratricopeptide repeat protein [Devosia rhodophyticola]